MEYISDCENMGKALIINNGKFIGKPDRKSDQDTIKLYQLFEELGYDTEVIHNCSFEKMRNKFISIGSADHSNYKTFLCAILSYSGELPDSVMTSDGMTFTIKNALELLNQGQHWHGKPKLIFIQACVTKFNKRATDDKVLNNDVKDCSVVVPATQDTLVVTSNLPASTRFSSQSYFVQSLCDVFSSNIGTKTEIHQLINRAMQNFYKLVSRDFDNRAVKLPKMKSTLSKRFHLR